MNTDDPNQSPQPTDSSNAPNPALRDLVGALQSVDTSKPDTALNATSIDDNNGGRIELNQNGEVIKK